MRQLGFIVNLGPGLYIANSEGAIVAFSTYEDAEAVAGGNATLVPIVRYRARRRPAPAAPAAPAALGYAPDAGESWKVQCPDGGACHHSCRPPACFRRETCEPLSGVFPGDRWPEPGGDSIEPGDLLDDPDRNVAGGYIPPGADEEDPPEPAEFDPGPEVDDEGGMSEIRARSDEPPF